MLGVSAVVHGRDWSAEESGTAGTHRPFGDLLDVRQLRHAHCLAGAGPTGVGAADRRRLVRNAAGDRSGVVAVASKGRVHERCLSGLRLVDDRLHPLARYVVVDPGVDPAVRWGLPLTRWERLWLGLVVPTHGPTRSVTTKYGMCMSW